MRRADLGRCAEHERLVLQSSQRVTVTWSLARLSLCRPAQS